MTLVAVKKDSDPAAWGAIGLYLLGAPTVHLLHRRPLATLGSLGLRIFLPLVGSAIGSATADCGATRVNDADACDFGEFLVGFGIGMAAAAIADSAFLAWDQTTAASPIRSVTEAAPSPPRVLSLSPVPLRGGAGLVFGGQF